jgi:hypothetical protein
MNPEIRAALKDPECLGRLLRRLPPPVSPKGLTTSLQVIASRARGRAVLSRRQRIGQWFAQIQLQFDNLMRPLALPAAGGFFSALALFGTLLVPTYPLRAAGSSDVPTMLTTEAAIRGTVPVGLGSSGEAVVDVMIDEQGRMVDYKVVTGSAVLANRTLRRRLENTLLFTEFIPATSFGMPVPISVVRVSVGLDSRVDVRG